MPTIVKTAAAAALLLSLAACSRWQTGQNEMSWARSALERNEHLEVMAADSQARTFTVKLKETGKVLVVPVDQIIAGPAAALTGSPGTLAPATADAASPTGAPAETPAPDTAEPASPSTASAPAAPPKSTEPQTEASTGGPDTDQTTPQSSDSAGEPPTPSESFHAASAVNAKAGSVLASGPGYTIKASGPSIRPRPPSPVTAPRGAPEHLHDPIVCQGARLLHIDNRNLQFDGDAITAEDGCEIHITNTHISAKGIGVQARAANVHIKNSEIDGDSGAVEASDGAQVYAESSRFKGLTRRLESSAFHDLGGNIWN